MTDIKPGDWIRIERTDYFPRLICEGLVHVNNSGSPAPLFLGPFPLDDKNRGGRGWKLLDHKPAPDPRKDLAHDDIRAALEAATPRPWVLSYPGQCCRDGYCIESRDTPHSVVHETGRASLADLRLITNAPTWLAELLAENERLTGEIARLKFEPFGHLVNVRSIPLSYDEEGE